MRIARKALLKALNMTKHGLSDEWPVEYMDSYLFSKGYVHTFSDDISVSSPLSLNIVGAVKADLLYPAIRAMRDGLIEIAVEGESLVAGNADMQVRMPLDSSPSALDAINHYRRPECNWKVPWRRTPPNFKDMLRICLTTIHDNPAKPSMCCVHWDRNALESTNNLIITRCILDKSAGYPDSVLIPRGCAEALIRCNPFLFAKDDDQMHFMTREQVILSCKIEDYKFPEIGQFLSADYTRSIELPIDDLKGMLKRARGVVRENHFGEKCVSIIIKKGTLTVLSDEENYETVESCAINSSTALKFSVSLEHLRQILEHPISSLVGIVQSDELGGLLRFSGENFIHLQSIALAE